MVVNMIVVVCSSGDLRRSSSDCNCGSCAVEEYDVALCVVVVVMCLQFQHEYGNLAVVIVVCERRFPSILIIIVNNHGFS